MSRMVSRKIAAFLTTAISLWMASCSLRQPAGPPASMSLNIAYEQQQADNWCWAASAVMVIKAIGGRATQCQTADLGVLGKDCCREGIPPDSCSVLGNWPPFAALGYTYRSTSLRAVSLEKLVDEIGIARTPVTASWMYTDTDGGPTYKGHMFVVGGYTLTAADNRLEIYDPLCSEKAPVDPARPCAYRIISYSEYEMDPIEKGKSYIHWNDYYEVRKP